MKKNKVATGAVILAAISILALGGCANSEPAGAKTTAPPTTVIYEPPVTSEAPVITTEMPPKTSVPAELEEIDGNQLYLEFKEDPEAAAAKYKGKRYAFKNVRADDMVPLYKGTGNDWYVLGGRVKFKPEYLSNLELVKIGDILDIEGEIGEIMYDLLIINNCSYTVIDDTDAVQRMQDTPFSFY